MLVIFVKTDYRWAEVIIYIKIRSRLFLGPDVHFSMELPCSQRLSSGRLVIVVKGLFNALLLIKRESVSPPRNMVPLTPRESTVSLFAVFLLKCFLRTPI